MTMYNRFICKTCLRIYAILTILVIILNKTIKKENVGQQFFQYIFINKQQKQIEESKKGFSSLPNRYIIYNADELIGKGGYADVYRGVHDVDKH